MLRRRLCRNADTALLSLAHDIDGPSRADMRNVNASPRILCQHDIAGHGNIFCNRRTPFQPEHGTAVALIHNAVLNQRTFFLMIDNDLIKSMEIIVCV